MTTNNKIFPLRGGASLLAFLISLGLLGWGIQTYRDRRLETDCTLPPGSYQEDCHFDKELIPGAALPNIVLIIIDAWRKDYCTPEASPKIWGFSKTGLRFDNYFVNAGYTKASVASLLSGQLPRFTKGVTNLGFEHLWAPGTDPSLYRRKLEAIDPLPPLLVTVPEILKNSRKYITIQAAQNPMVGNVSGYGIRHWDLQIDLGLEGLKFGGDTLVNRSLKEIRNLRKRGDKAPFFLYVHLMDTHEPYDRSEMSKKKLALQTSYFATKYSGDIGLRSKLLPQMKDFYARGVRFDDRQISRLVAGLEKIEPASRTVYFVSADHGEMFNETGQSWNIAHGGNIPREIISVPMIIFGGWIKPRVVEDLHQGIDLAPTILNLSGIAAPPQMTGDNLIYGKGVDRLEAYSPFETVIVARKGGSINLEREPLE